MKGPQLLALLLGLAAIAAVLLVWKTGPGKTGPGPVGENVEEEIHLFVARQFGHEPGNLPSLERVSRDRLEEEVARSLEAQFGSAGLARRAQAYALLHLLPESQDLAFQWAAAQASANRGIATASGTILLAQDFDMAHLGDRGRLARLMANQRLGPAGPAPDDRFLAEWAVRGGIAAEIEARYIAQSGGRMPLPTDAEMDHEALLLSLPVFTHNLMQLPLMEGRDAVRRRLTANEDFEEILAALPRQTLALLAPAALPEPTPAPPERPGLVLAESLGAYSTRLLCERLSDQVEAAAIGPAWRADRYSFYQDDAGQHICWISLWADEETAARVARLLQGRVTPDDPAGRHERVTHNGVTVIFANCADEITLDELLPRPLDSATTSP